MCGLASLLVTHCGSERARFERKPRLCHLSTLLPAAPDAHEVQRARQALRSELGETQGRVQRTAPSPQGAPPPGHYAHPAVGAQDAVSTGGPALALLGFLVLPLVWSVPEALVTAELATAFPEDSGYVAWVTAAFGPFWGFQEGWWSWLSGVTDNSVYPVLLLSYVDAVLPGARAPARAAPAHCASLARAAAVVRGRRAARCARARARRPGPTRTVPGSCPAAVVPAGLHCRLPVYERPPVHNATERPAIASALDPAVAALPL